MLNGIRVRELSHGGRNLLALATRCALEVFGHAHDRLVGREASRSIFTSLRAALLGAFAKLADANRHTSLNRTHFLVYVAVLRAALRAAQDLREQSAVDDLRRLLQYLPRHKSSKPALDHAAAYVTWLVLSRDRILARIVTDRACDQATSVAA